MATDNVNFRHGSPLMVDHTPVSAVAAGEVVVVGDTPYIAHKNIAAGELGHLASRGGVYRGDKTSGSGTAVVGGTRLYWDASGNKVTTTAGSNKIIGQTTPDGAADADTTIDFEHAPTVDTDT